MRKSSSLVGVVGKGGTCSRYMRHESLDIMLTFHTIQIIQTLANVSCITGFTMYLCIYTWGVLCNDIQHNGSTHSFSVSSGYVDVDIRKGKGRKTIDNLL